ncbi:MAG: 50S ribosomal protein L21 [Bacteroidetes bacterium]|nr:50S ribosomal protein L21 [Bacteroidota bacterium]MCK5765866.1 50S ribosomal protein L21 [Bacteroidales bacterium]
MYAIVEIAGQQFKVEKKQEIFVHRLEGKEGSKVEFSEVMLIDNNGKVSVGTPMIKDALVSAKILEHMKADKVLVFKKKRRKGYQKLNGHRQYMTRLVIENILENAPKAAAPKAEKPDSAKATTAKKETAPKAKPKAAAKPKATKPAEVKKAAPKKTTATKKAAPKAAKPAAKKAAPKKEAKPKAAPKAKKADSDKKEDK